MHRHVSGTILRLETPGVTHTRNGKWETGKWGNGKDNAGCYDTMVSCKTGVYMLCKVAKVVARGL